MLSNITNLFLSQLRHVEMEYGAKVKSPENRSEMDEKIQIIMKNFLASFESYFTINLATESDIAVIHHFKQNVQDIAERCSDTGLVIFENIDRLLETNIKALEVIALGFQTLPENIEDLPTEFTTIPLATFEKAKRVLTTEAPERQGVVVDGKGYFNKPLEELNRLKSRLGGSPIFGSSRPTLNEADNTKTFFGFPMASVKDWLRLVLNQKRSPVAFWKGIARLFGVTESNKTSQYEEAHLRIQRFGLLIANKERFFDILKKQDAERYHEFSSITGLGWHPKDNGSGTEKLYIELVEVFLTTYFEAAKQKGDDALLEYFNVFEGACFEARAHCLEEYIRQHPIDEMAETMKIAESIIDINTHAPVREAFDKVFMDLGTKLAGVSATPKQLFEEIQKNNIFEMEFPKTDGSKAKPTLEDFHQFALDMIDAYILEPYSLADLVKSELDIFLNNLEIEHTESNFRKQLQKRNDQNRGTFNAESTEVHEIIQSYIVSGKLTAS